MANGAKLIDWANQQNMSNKILSRQILQII